MKSAALLGITAPMMAMAIPLLDAGVAVVRRFLRRQPIWGPDRRHIHHLLLDRGLTHGRAALLMYGLCALAATFSLLQNAMQKRFGAVIIVLFCAAAWFGIQRLEYPEFRIATRLLFRGAFRHIVDEHSRLQEFKTSLSDARDLDQCWGAIRRGCKDFGFVGIRMSVQGRIFEDAWRHPPEDRCWQLRIPLAGSQYVNLYRDLHKDIRPTPLAEFAHVLRTDLKVRLEKLNGAGGSGKPLAAAEKMGPQPASASIEPRTALDHLSL